MPRGHRPAFDRAHAVEEQVERALCRDRGIELAQAARGSVARIRECLLAARGLARVQRCEGTTGHEDLAPRLEHGRQVLAAQLDRHRADRPHVDGDVLAPRAVATGGSLHEAALLVAQRDREAVDLGLGRVGDLLHVEPFPRAPVEVEDVLLAECVVEREHRHRVHDLAELA